LHDQIPKLISTSSQRSIFCPIPKQLYVILGFNYFSMVQDVKVNCRSDRQGGAGM